MLLPGENEDDEVGDGFIMEEIGHEMETKEETTEINDCRMLDLSLYRVAGVKGSHMIKFVG